MPPPGQRPAAPPASPSPLPGAATCPCMGGQRPKVSAGTPPLMTAALLQPALAADLPSEVSRKRTLAKAERRRVPDGLVQAPPWLSCCSAPGAAASLPSGTSSCQESGICPLFHADLRCSFTSSWGPSSATMCLGPGQSGGWKDTRFPSLPWGRDPAPVNKAGRLRGSPGPGCSRLAQSWEERGPG